ncbi:hypothetical protein CKK33_11465 [Mucilaginibacter sp. MD40]|uniref:hypothetical protein n=1 Tax=Mucilaginibacter sp. MD40 TaxID=2029590 RepID=UPI000BACD679|nr:hypothetical protein [Mucilaginibacter sp. MD40]PAW94079.1 hypothetical protein CKK33_11465 [Mucilaginibacter sp. MD40]
MIYKKSLVVVNGYRLVDNGGGDIRCYLQSGQDYNLPFVPTHVKLMDVGSGEIVDHLIEGYNIFGFADTQKIYNAAKLYDFPDELLIDCPLHTANGNSYEHCYVLSPEAVISDAIAQKNLFIMGYSPFVQPVYYSGKFLLDDGGFANKIVPDPIDLPVSMKTNGFPKPPQAADVDGEYILPYLFNS